MKSAALALLSLAVTISACGDLRSTSDAAERDRILTELTEIYERGDFWELRERLSTQSRLEAPRAHLLRAEVAHAFNDPRRSNEHLSRLQSHEQSLSDSLELRAAQLRFRNHLRLHQYGNALEAGRTLLSLPEADSATRDDVENELRAMEALADVPAQRVLSRAASRISRLPNGRVPMQIGDSVRGYVLDTGANLSAMMRSEAEALGLTIREAGVRVGTSTGSSVNADVTVAPHLKLGETTIESVVFLVVPDELLTFGPDFRIPGIIGFPVIDALGEVRFARGGIVEIPARVPQRNVNNLAMDYLTPLVRIRVLEHDAVCELDTGAYRTSLHLPFLERHRAEVEARGRIDTFRTAGVGGERTIAGYALDSVRIVMGDTSAVLPSMWVYAESVATGEDVEADCRLGVDALNTFDGYLLNFRSMTFLPL
ncbi:MAG: retropepsin-like aspartic protease [Gemmatimonadota bacterium]|nr:retropepsin-like aspartic protease [Gemmatimonadota bacterium]